MSQTRAVQIREAARRLLAEGKVDVFLGFQAATVPLRSRPAFAREASEAELLVWDSFCANNLAAYLPKYYENQPGRRQRRERPYPRVGLAAKGCDLRSVVALVKERQVRRDHLVIVGVPCQGMIDARKVEAAARAQAGAGAAGGQIVGHAETDAGVLEVTTREGAVLSFPREEVLQDCCRECRYPSPEGADILVSGDARPPGDGGYARVKHFEGRTPEQRWEHFRSELSRCIRCNACRQACPTCWCKECFAEHVDLKWIGVGTDPSDAMLFQIIRIFHQAGRCTECDACYRACPMGIDLRLYTKKMVKDVEELFRYLPAFDAQTLPPLSTFGEEPLEFFITDPDKAAGGPGE